MTSHLNFKQPLDRPRRRNWVRPAAIALLVAGSGAALGAVHFGLIGPAPALGAQAGAAASAPPPPVTVSLPLQRREAAWTDFTGRFAAVDYVEIRAQVSGYLTEIHFTDGQIVHKGDLLFIIDPRPYQIQLEQAEAGVQAAEAQLLLSNKELSRINSLQNSGAVTKEQLDQRVQQQDAADAALAQAKAAVQAAQVNLDFTHVTAPFTGRVSAHRVSVGSLVLGGGNASATTLLTTIVSLDPIHLDFQMSEDDYLAYERYVHGARPGAPVDDKVEAALSDEQGFPRRGTLDFVDNRIDSSSGTIEARATLPNHDLFIAPGEFAELRLPTSAVRTVLLVPDSAIVSDQSNKLLMTVAADGTVAPKIVQTGGLVDGLREIDGGLLPGDRVVINGLLRAQPGTKVTPEAGSIATLAAATVADPAE